MLAKIGSDKVVQPLIKAFKKQQTIYGINVINSNEAEKIIIDKSIESLIQAIKNQDVPASRYTMEALIKIGSNNRIKPFNQSFTDHDSSVRWQALNSLQRTHVLNDRIDTDVTVEFLVNTLKDKDFYVRKKALELLAGVMHDKAIEPLIQYIKHQDYALDIKKLLSLRKIEDIESLETIIQGLHSKNVLTSRLAALILVEIGSDEAVESLIKSLHNYKCVSRWNAVVALGRIGNEKAIEALIQHLVDISEAVSNKIVDVLRKLVVFDHNLSTLTKQLPYLERLVSVNSYHGKNLVLVITVIQSRCKYYNYAVAQTPLPPEDDPNSKIGNIYNFHGKVEQVFAGNPTVQGDNIATQNNQKTVPES